MKQLTITLSTPNQFGYYAGLLVGLEYGQDLYKFNTDVIDKKTNEVYKTDCIVQIEVDKKDSSKYVISYFNPRPKLGSTCALLSNNKSIILFDNIALSKKNYFKAF